MIGRTLPTRRAVSARLAPALTTALVLAVTAAGTATAAPSAAKPVASATVEQCVTSVEQSERAVTLVGEMTALPGTARMQMRIELQERGPKEEAFHGVSDPGIGQWLRAAPGVHIYKNLDKVTNLSAPAVYRGEVHFRWLNARGHLIKALALRTGRCEQPSPPTRTAPALGATGAAPPATTPVPS
jgi:hypothetical protein